MMSALRPDIGMTLGALFSDCPAPLADVRVQDLTLHSGDVQPGGLFVALAGRSGHGLDHLEEALARGAAAVAWEPAENIAPPRLPDTVAGIRAPLLRARLGMMADRFFGQPSAGMALAAVTGTNGKTTVAWLVARALEADNHPCAYVGTLGRGRPAALAAATLTTPDVITLHRWLADAHAAGCRHGTLEASSHALDQARLDGVRLRVAAFTNLSHEHLDYHGSLEAYAAAKARLFAWPGLEWAVINADDPQGARLLAALPAGVSPLAVSLNGFGGGAGRRLVARAAPSASGGLTLAWSLDGAHGELESPLVGRFNAGNLALALGILVALGLPPDRAAARLARVAPPPGRMQGFGGAGHAPLVIVDFAHTPDALERALEALREQRPRARLYCVFGCGGERDREKRPLMGEVAARLADEVILTDDNPRGEDAEQIIAAIQRGAGARGARVIRDRRAAIATAIGEARAGDVVLVAGKGHERSQQVGDQVLPFSDADVVRDVLEALR
ncbi:MAG: UDP-N-acetylmuramoyl-L-alanyl-D-glutamate--2,6-diaminopimelate ligase [Gammaproteobacteria bacterium]|nr:MAG: UDP-N-acetylmuramoyl-L-alanyl-D-glutamate--2,6-diaminopimelate ligase [Gammaproteobacteria bacterium]